MTLLIIDTTKPTVWVALVGDRKTVAEREWTGDTQLGTKLLAAINAMSQEVRPKRIAVHRGPGHFMLLRTGVVTAQLLAAAWGVELVAIEGDTRSALIKQAVEAVPTAVVTPAY